MSEISMFVQQVFSFSLTTSLSTGSSILFTGAPEEHLVAMVESTSSTGEALANKLMEVLSELGLGLDQLVGQGYDGGSNMRGGSRGVQARIKEKCPRALYTWCWSHSLQLVMSHAADESIAAADCFRQIKDVYASVSSSAHRTTIMERHLLHTDMLTDEIEAEEKAVIAEQNTDSAEPNADRSSDGSTESAAEQVHREKESKYRRLLSISGTRFIARTRNLQIFKHKLPQIKAALCEMGLESLASTLDSRFQATVSALYSILCPISDLSQALQTPDLNLLGAQNQLNLLINQLKLLRTEDAFNNLVLSPSNVNTEPNQTAPPAPEEGKKKRKRNLPTNLSDSVIMHAMPIWSSSQRNFPTLLIHEYYEILDLVAHQIDIRFDNPALGALSALEDGKMTPALAEFCRLHGRDVETVDRQLSFTSSSLRATKSPGSRLQLQELFCQSAVQQDLHYMLDVALTLPVTSSNAERAFSKLRLIKSHLRTTMSASRLQSLLRLSANKSVTSLIAVEKMLQKFSESERKIVL